MANKLGDLIRDRMKALGIETNVALAEKLGVSGGYIGDLINNTGKSKRGYYIPSPEMVGKLSKHLLISQTKILQSIGYQVEDLNTPEFTELKEIFQQLDHRHQNYVVLISRILRDESSKGNNLSIEANEDGAEPVLNLRDEMKNNLSEEFGEDPEDGQQVGTKVA